MPPVSIPVILRGFLLRPGLWLALGVAAAALCAPYSGGQALSANQNQSKQPASVIRFEEIAAKAGLRYVTAHSPTPNKYQPETMVAGVALLDYDRDGFLDVYLVSGASFPSLEAEALETHGQWNQAEALYRKILTQYPDLPGVHYRPGRIILSRPATTMATSHC
jgi:hypothetical protein